MFAFFTKVYNRLFSTRMRLIRRWNRAKNNGKSFITIRLKDNTKFLLFTDSRLCNSMVFNEFEVPERIFLRRFLRKGDIFADIGSNIGLYTVLAANYVGKQGRVFSFEPVEKTFGRLIDNIDLNRLNNVIPLKKGVSNQNGRSEIMVSMDGYDAWNSMGKPSQGENFVKQSIETITLDTIYEEYWKSNYPKFIKIDVEGWECNVIAGGEKCLKEINDCVLLMEFTEQNLINAGFNSRILYDQLRDLGFAIFRYHDDDNSIEEEKNYGGPYPYINFIISRSSSFILDRISDNSY